MYNVIRYDDKAGLEGFSQPRQQNHNIDSVGQGPSVGIGGDYMHLSEAEAQGTRAASGPKARNQTSFQEEFQVARNLPGTKGAFVSARLYTSLHGNTTNPIEAFAAAVNTNTSLLLGIWISGTPNIQNEVNAILASAAKHDSAFVDLVVGISVGSEDVRSALRGSSLQGKPIGHVDTYNTFVNSSGWMMPIIEAVDFIGMNAFPYFEDTKSNGIDNGNATFWADYDAVVTQAGSKEIWITETGWPSSGPRSGAAVPSVPNAETCFREVYCSIATRNINVWWYTLQDRETDSGVPSFGATSLSGHELKYDLSC